MGVAHRIGTNQAGTKQSAATPTVIRRNMQSRLAGLGYAAVTLLWLGLLQAQAGAPSLFAEAILAVFVLIGVGLALNRDDLVISPAARTVTHVRGLFGRIGTVEYDFADFEAVAIEEGGVAVSGAETSGPYTRRWAGVALAEKQTRETIRLWSADGDDGAATREALYARARNRADEFAALLSLPVRETASVRESAE